MTDRIRLHSSSFNTDNSDARDFIDRASEKTTVKYLLQNQIRHILLLLLLFLPESLTLVFRDDIMKKNK